MNDKNPRDLSKVTCFKCQKKGHIATNCPVKNSGELKKEEEKPTGPVTRSAAKAGLNARRIRTEKPDQAKVFGDISWRLELDSGSDETIVSVELYKKVVGKHGFTSLPMDVETVYMADRECTSRILHKVKWDIEVSTAKGPVKLRDVIVYVVDAEVDEILLGKSTMKALGIDLDEIFSRLASETMEYRIDDAKLEGKLKLNRVEFTEYLPVADDDDDEMDITDDVGMKLPDLIQEVPQLNVIFPELAEFSVTDQLLLDNFYIGTIKPWVQLCNNDPVTDYEMDIQLKLGVQPVRSQQRRYSEKQMKFMDEWIKDLLNRGWIKAVFSSRWASAVVVVNDKLGEPKRGTVDLRSVNQLVVPEAFPMPLIEVVLQKTRGSKVFSVIDFEKGYWQIAAKEKAGEIMTIMTHNGMYASTRLMQGFVNGVSIFQSVVSGILQGIENVIIWVDDVLVFTVDVLGMIQTLQEVYERFLKRNVKISWKKSRFFTKKVKYLGRIIDGDGVRFDDEKIQTMVNLPIPTNGGELGQFIHMANFMRTSIPDFSRTVKPLMDLHEIVLTKANSRKKAAAARVSIVDLWGNEHLESYDAVKKKLAVNMKMCHVYETDDIYVLSDASDDGWGILVAKADPKEREKPFLERDMKPVLCLSGIFRGSSKNWSTVSKEMYGFVVAVD